MKISGWGRYPVIDAKLIELNKLQWQDPFITAGNFRSYGDAALSKYVLPMKTNNRFIAFNEKTGLLTCESGVLLSEIIDIFFPRGWFLTVTPGTKQITVGGAIAADVHGKNHHVKGCFSACVESFQLILPHYQIKNCSRTENKDLFHATCGGMGLTGIIHKVSFYLQSVQSKWVEQTTVKTADLQETLDVFEETQSNPYSAAWIDCSAKGEQLGRSILMLGDFAKDGDLTYSSTTKFHVPFDLPSFTLNSFSIKAFNAIYYGNTARGESRQKTSLDSFFYPLDKITNWNRIYGKKGFIQFQFVLPKIVSYAGLRDILQYISQSDTESFLAVLKLHGPQNDNWLSFPLEGYSLAMDFKMGAGLASFLHILTESVIDLGGRVYLAKDALLTRAQFDQCYSNSNKFRALREELGLSPHFQSYQSQRLSL